MYYRNDQDILDTLFFKAEWHDDFLGSYSGCKIGHDEFITGDHREPFQDRMNFRGTSSLLERSQTPQLHVHDELCVMKYTYLLERLPITEVGVAQLIKSFATRDEQNLRYSTSSEKWEVLEEGQYRELEGNHLIKEIVARLAGFYSPIALDANGSIKDQATLHAKSMATLTVYGTFEKQEAEPTEAEQAAWDKVFDLHFDQYKMWYGKLARLTEKLTDSRGINSIIGLLESFMRGADVEQAVTFKSINADLARDIEPELAEGIIPARGLGFFYGPSYSGKSIMTIGFALSVAAGLDSWMGYPLNVSGPQTVAYFASEGEDQAVEMVRAWKRHNPDADISGFHFIGPKLVLGPSGLEEGNYGVNDFIRDCDVQGMNPRLVVVDTLTASTGEEVDDNSPAIYRAVKPLRDWGMKKNVMTILVHHTGKDASRGMRGSQSLFDGADCVAFLNGTEGDTRTLDFKKIKGRTPDGVRVDLKFVEGASGGFMQFNGARSLPEAVRKHIEEQAPKLTDEIKVLHFIPYEDAGITGTNRGQILSQMKDAKEYHVPDLKVRDTLKKLETDGVILNLGTEARPCFYRVRQEA